MNTWLCTACHHEWQGAVQTCDWCSAKGEVIDVTEISPTVWQLLPPPETACQICGRDPAHRPEDPHDKQKLY